MKLMRKKTVENELALAPKKRKLTKNDWQLYSLCIIPVLLVFVFHYLPMGGLVIAFKDYRYDLGIFGSPWVALKNFEFFLTSSDFTRITWNTLSMNFIFIFLTLCSSVTVAVLLFCLKSRTATKIFQTMMITPHFLSWVVVSYMVYGFLNPTYGLLNNLLAKFGIVGIDWYAWPNAWPVILAIWHIWKGVGMSCVIYYATLMGIDSGLFEAADIDGAGPILKFRKIMLPELVPIITIQTILSIGNIFRADFGLFYQLPRDVGLLYPRTDVIDTYVFRAMRVIGDMSMASAVSFLQSIVGFLMVMATNFVVKRISPENSLF